MFNADLYNYSVITMSAASYILHRLIKLENMGVCLEERVPVH